MNDSLALIKSSVVKPAIFKALEWNLPTFVPIFNLSAASLSFNCANVKL